MQVDDIINEFANEHSVAKKGNIAAELTQAMIDERMAPELLPYRHELMEKVVSSISQQQELVLEWHEYGDSHGADIKLQLMVLETDIDRLAYVVRVYLRTRLRKLDKFCIYYVSSGAQLSEPEEEYMRRHLEMMTSLYNGSFLRKMPGPLQLMDDPTPPTMIVQPDLDSVVFIKVKKSVTVIVEEEEMELVKGGVYAVRYNVVKTCVMKGDVLMI